MVNYNELKFGIRDVEKPMEYTVQSATVIVQYEEENKKKKSRCLSCWVPAAKVNRCFLNRLSGIPTLPFNYSQHTFLNLMIRPYFIAYTTLIFSCPG